MGRGCSYYCWALISSYSCWFFRSRTSLSQLKYNRADCIVWDCIVIQVRGSF